MYSKNKGMTDRREGGMNIRSEDRSFTLTPPPGYDGSRFKTRSDGRDDAFPMYGDPDTPYHRCTAVPCGRRHPGDIHNTHHKDHDTANCPDGGAVRDMCENDDCREDVRCLSDCCRCDTDRAECGGDCRNEDCRNKAPFSSFLKNIGKEEILLIALIFMIAGSSCPDPETVILLALILCAG